MFLLVFLFYLLYLLKLQTAAVIRKSCLFYLKIVSIGSRVFSVCLIFCILKLLEHKM